MMEADPTMPVGFFHGLVDTQARRKRTAATRRALEAYLEERWSYLRSCGSMAVPPNES